MNTEILTIKIRDMYITLPMTRKVVEGIANGKLKKLYMKVHKFYDKIDMERGYCKL
jgi:hypothetical protein